MEAERLTGAPPEGAGPLSVTVPVDDAPPTTVDAEKASDVSAVAGVTVSTAVFVVPLLVAVIVTGVAEPTALVRTVTEAPGLKAGIVMLAGSGSTPGEELVSVTVRFAMSKLLRRTPTVAVEPPTSDDGSKKTESRATGVKTSSQSECVALRYVPEIVQ
jgi:hypothetical protein